MTPDELRAELAAVDHTAAVAAIRAQLEATFRRYTTFRGITAIELYWAGTEIPPYIASDVMASVYAGNVLVGDCVGGFTPIPLPDLVEAVDEDPITGDDEALVEEFVAMSLELSRRAVAEVVTTPTFAALSIARPFTIRATPGHDEPWIVLYELR